MTINNVPPHSMEFEQGVIGGLIKDANCQKSREILDTLDPLDFYSRVHGEIFHTIKRMSENRDVIDLNTLEIKLESNKIDFGGYIYLAEMVNNFISHYVLASYVKQIKEHKTQRDLLMLSQSINDAILNKRTSCEIVSNIEHEIKSISVNSNGKELKHIKEATGDWLDNLDKRAEAGGGILGLSTGFDQIDERLCGIGDESLVIVAGRPSMGKTLFSQAICQNVGIIQDKNTMFFSMEMSSNELYERFVSGMSNVPADTLRRANFNNEDLGRVHNAVTTIDKSKIYFTDEPTQSLGQIRSKARKHKNKFPDTSLIVIDYLGLMELDKADRHDIAVGKITRGLKQLAKEIKVPIMLICQANRDLDKAKRPAMSNLKDSSSIEADADVIMFVHRQEVIEPETELKGVTEIIIAKDRHNGGNGTVYMKKTNGTFEELSSEQVGMLEHKEELRTNPVVERKTRGYKR